MANIAESLHLGSNVTSNGLKRNLFTYYGFSNISNPSLVEAISNAEGKNPLYMFDRFPDSPIVLHIAVRKALAVWPHVNYLYFTHRIVLPIRVNDAVYSLKNGGPERVILNKAESDEDVVRIRNLYQEMDGSVLYSTAATHLVMPDFLSPITQSVFTKLRLGKFKNPGGNFVPDKENAAGFTTSEAIQNGLVRPIN